MDTMKVWHLRDCGTPTLNATPPTTAASVSTRSRIAHTQRWPAHDF